MTKSLAVYLLLIGLLVGPASAQGVYDGFWEGTLTSGDTFEFTVVDDIVDDVLWSQDAGFYTCPSGADPRLGRGSLRTEISIVDDSFTITAEFADGQPLDGAEEPTIARGVFLSRTEASGTLRIGVATMTGAGLATQSCFASESWTAEWIAEPRTAPSEPPATNALAAVASIRGGGIYDGTWEGITDSGETMSFTITDDLVNAGWSIGRGETTWVCPTEAEIGPKSFGVGDGLAPIVDDSFVVTFDAEAGIPVDGEPLSIIIEGHFDSLTEVSGTTISVHAAYRGDRAMTQACLFADTWSIEKVD